MTLKSVGIIAEYDPFHHGHQFQLEAAKEKTGADVVVVVMSSNWTQRGEPAIYDKWTRTQMALNGGADLVVELPIQSAVQPASIFAEKAIELITELKCDYLSFGSEHSEIDFNQLKEIVINSDSDLFNDYQKTFPQIFQAVLQKQLNVDVSSPNDMLGFWYAQAAQRYNPELKLFPISRIESEHNDSVLKHRVSSGKAIRLAIKNGQSQVDDFLPSSVDDLQPLFWDDYWPFLQYQINQSSLEELRNIYQMSAGLEHLFKKVAIKAKNFAEFIASIKSKRYTYTRIQRLCVYILFKITDQDIIDSQSMLRILGMNNQGKEYLSQLKKTCSVPIISKIDKEAFEKQLYLECKAGTLTGMILKKHEDLYRFPIILNN
ncbi:nucleotidyltransferase [Fructilactobacillus vespulae]|uniref:nucleotidyltransferase n=1 Tax=Fructilactobacillus vespulae TaxID=1249630 RepID=UPI0039B5298A